jgi:hypothetical protein
MKILTGFIGGLVIAALTSVSFNAVAQSVGPMLDPIERIYVIISCDPEGFSASESSRLSREKRDDALAIHETMLREALKTETLCADQRTRLYRRVTYLCSFFWNPMQWSACEVVLVVTFSERKREP